MHADGEQQLVPQTTEDIMEIRWVKPEELEQYMAQSFPSVIDVLKLYLAY